MRASILRIMAACLLAGTVFGGQEITKESLSEVCPGLKLKVISKTDSHSTININIPRDTFKSMFQAWFVMPGEDKGEQLRVPVQVHTIDGLRSISVSGSPELLRKAVVKLDCKFADPRVSALHVYDIALSSFLNTPERFENKKDKTMATDAEEPVPVNPNLRALNNYRPVMKVVNKHYPQATSLLFEDTLTFEDSTELHVEEMISKLPGGQSPQLEAVRGPKSTGGVWCQIWVRKGISPTYQRPEGARQRKHFVEYMIYQDLHGIDCRLYVTLRVPKREKNADFVKEFTGLIRSYSHDFVTDK